MKIKKNICKLGLAEKRPNPSPSTIEEE